MYQAVVVELGFIEVSRAKVVRLIHGPGCHDSDEFVKERVVGTVNLVQAFLQLLVGAELVAEAQILHDAFDLVDFLGLWLVVLPEHGQ